MTRRCVGGSLEPLRAAGASLSTTPRCANGQSLCQAESLCGRAKRPCEVRKDGGLSLTTGSGAAGRRDGDRQTGRGCVRGNKDRGQSRRCVADEEGWVMLVMLVMLMLSERGGWERTDDSRWHVVALATLSFEAYCSTTGCSSAATECASTAQH